MIRKLIMPDNRDLSYHSEPVQEIMGSIPSWITRWGVTVLFSVFLLIVIGCCIIKYPQTVQSTISITSDYPPSELTARYDGLIDRVCVMDGQKVEQGELIALLATPAKYEDVMTLVDFLAKTDSVSLRSLVNAQILSNQLELGNLQNQWIAVQKAFRDYSHYLELDQVAVKTDLLRKQIVSQKGHYATLGKQKAMLDREIVMDKRSHGRDSVLYARKAISEEEYEASQKSYLSKLNSAIGFDASLEATAFNILQLEQQLVELDLQRKSETESYESLIQQQIYQLKAQIASWLDTFAILSPSDGVISLQDFWSSGQHVNVGNVIAYVIPENPAVVTGRMKIASAGFGKVAVGQTVNVKLNGFPYMEYGILKGTVTNVASVPERLQNGSIAYTVSVAFPNGLESTYHKTFPLIQQMDGTAEIITKDRRLIHQFIDPIISLFENR